MAPSVLIVGAGGALGAALCAEFLGAGYRVVGMRRHADQGAPTEPRIVPCELSDPCDVETVAQTLVREQGGIDVVVCNAAHLKIAPFAELEFADLEMSWLAAVGTTFGALRAVLPAMQARRRGAVILSGATGSMRGSAGFAAFAAAKFALRGLAQALAREYDAHGIHVAHVVLDGILRGSESARRFAKADAQCIEPRAVAALYRQLAEQPPQAWTHEADVRPRGEKF